jgi:hypothetical protein
MPRREGTFAIVLLAAMWVSACSRSVATQGNPNGGTSGQGGVSGMAGTSSQGGASGGGGLSGQSGGGQRDAEMDTPVGTGLDGRIDGESDAGWNLQDCGFAPSSAHSFTWTERAFMINGWGNATLSSEGGRATLTLMGTYAAGTVGGVNYDLTAVLTGGVELAAATYTCGVDATATYRTRTGDFVVSSCAFTLDEEIVPGCNLIVAKGTFTMTVVEPDGGTRQITDGKFNIGLN